MTLGTITTILTHTTCGEACWKAEELVCRCSCGGANHGCLKAADGVRPVRTAKLNGIRYELAAVGGRELLGEAQKINKACLRHVKIGTWEKNYPWLHTDPGAPAKIKHASAAQIVGWPELAAWADKTDRERYFAPVYLLWKRIDAAPVVME